MAKIKEGIYMSRPYTSPRGCVLIEEKEGDNSVVKKSFSKKKNGIMDPSMRNVHVPRHGKEG